MPKRQSPFFRIANIGLLGQALLHINGYTQGYFEGTPKRVSPPAPSSTASSFQSQGVVKKQNAKALRINMDLILNTKIALYRRGQIDDYRAQPNATASTTSNSSTPGSGFFTSDQGPQQSAPVKTTSSAQTPTKETEKISVADTIFELSLPVEHTKFYTAHADVRLPLRTLNGKDSEFGGYNIGLHGVFWEIAGYDIQIEKVQSDKLKLFSNHNAISIGAFYQEQLSLMNDNDLRLRLGPELRPTYGYVGPETDYGSLFGFNASMQQNIILEDSEKFIFDLKWNFHQGSQVKWQGGKSRGRAHSGIHAGLEYFIWPNLSAGLLFEMALSKPEGEEYKFGTTKLPGLYGNTIGVSVRAFAL